MARQPARLWPATLLALTLGTSPVAAQSPRPARVFDSVLTQLRQTEGIPVLLPATLPAVLHGTKVYARLDSAAPDSYSVELRDRGVDGNVGFEAGFFAKRDSAPPRAKHPFRLASGALAGFLPVGCGGSCHAANLWWSENGVSYELSIMLDSRMAPSAQAKILVATANAMVRIEPRETQRHVVAPDTTKPRVVVTTDPELDDSNSLLRYLLYSTDFRTEGIVYASSQFHWKGDGTGKKFMVPGREYTKFGLNLCPCESWRWAPNERFIDDDVDIYEKVYPNLRVHRADYPTPAELRSKIRWGNVDFDGDISRDTPGSNLIRDLLLDERDPSPIYLLAWGGASTIARALKSIEDQHAATSGWPALQARVSRKAILSLSGDQDDTYATYIHPHWPDIRSLPNGTGGVNVAYGAFIFASAENAPYFSVDWTRANVSSQGPLGEHYRVWGDGKQMVKGDRFDYFGIAGKTAAELRADGYVVWLPPRPRGEFLGEGDTFTYLNLLDNGLASYRDETPGGWAGHPTLNPATQPPAARATGAMAGGIEAFMKSLEGIGPEGPTTRPPSPWPNFTPAAQNDFAARVKWSVTPTLAGANHEPVVELRGSARLSARAGETVRLEVATWDQEGNVVTVRCWRWKDVDSYPGEVSIPAPTAVDGDPTEVATSFRVPDDAKPGQTLQIVIEGTDNGTPPLTHYQRVVVTVVP